MRKSKALGVLDHHDGGGGHIDADLDHRRRHQKPDLAGGELGHHAILLGAFHLAVHESDLVAKTFLQTFETLGGVGEMIGTLRLGFLNQRTNPVDQLARGKRAADRLHDFVDAACGYCAGIDRLAARRLFAQFRDIHVAEIGQDQRARDRRCAEHQHIDGFAFGGQRQPLAHSETVLLVDDRQRQRLEHHIVLDQRMSADQQIDLTGVKPLQYLAPFLARFAAGEDRHAKTGAFGERRDGLDMLARQNFGRRHQRRLLADFGHRGRRQQRHHRLARSDIALQQPQHAHRLAQVFRDGCGRLPLRGCQSVGQCVDDLVAQAAVAGMALAGGTAQLRTHQRQRQLSGQQFIERQPRPERTVRQDVRQLEWHMHAVQRFLDWRKLAAADDLGADPFRQAGKFWQR